MKPEKYEILDQAEGQYTVRCCDEIMHWLLQHEDKNECKQYIDPNWYLHTDTFVMCKKMFMMMVLKYGS